MLKWPSNSLKLVKNRRNDWNDLYVSMFRCFDVLCFDCFWFVDVSFIDVFDVFFDFWRIFKECSDDFLMDFRCSFTTSIQYVGEPAHAETLRLRSVFNDFHVRCFYIVLIVFRFSMQHGSKKNAWVCGPISTPFYLPKSRKNVSKINENPLQNRC